MGTRAEAYADAALRRAVEAVAGAGSNRNDALNQQAYGLGRLVAAGALDRAEVVRDLADAAAACGLVGRKPGVSWSNRQAAERAIGRSVDQGAKKPRELPADAAPPGRGARQRRAPPKPKPRPAPLELPPAPELDPGAAALAAAVWRIVEPLAPTPEAKAWLTGRGLDVAAAWRQGCRDWRPALPELRAALRDATPEACQAVGFDEPDTGKPWWPLRAAMEGIDKAAGLAVPCRVAPGGPPMRWRWRCFATPWDRGPKELAAYGPALPLVAAGDAASLVVCEGTPDFLAVAEVVAGRAVVVGLVAVSAGLPPWLRPLLRDAGRRVVVVTHDAAGGEAAAVSIGRELARLVGLAAATARFARLVVAEADDCADRHKRGELADELLPLLDVPAAKPAAKPSAEAPPAARVAAPEPAPDWQDYSTRPKPELDAVRAELRRLAPELDPGAGSDWQPHAEDVALFCWYGWHDCATSLTLVARDLNALWTAADKLPRLVATRLADVMRGNQ